MSQDHHSLSYAAYRWQKSSSQSLCDLNIITLLQGRLVQSLSNPSGPGDCLQREEQSYRFSH